MFRRWLQLRTPISIGVLLVIALSMPSVIVGTVKALTSTSNDPRQWLPRDFEETRKNELFRKQFGRDEISVVSWPGCTLDDPRVEKLAQALDKSKYFQRVITGPRAVERLDSESKEADRETAIERLQGTLIGPDRNTTCIVAVISARGEQDRTVAVEEIIQLAQSECKLARDDLRMGGPTVDAATIDEESRRLLFQLAGFCISVTLIVAGFRLRSIRLASGLLIAAVYSTVLSLAVLHWTGGTMNMLLTMLPPLVYVLTISAGVHLVNYYRDAIRENGIKLAAWRAVVRGWFPCVLSAGTTAIGLISLATSKIVPIQQFGIYSSIGMLISVAVLLVVLPSALHLFLGGVPRLAEKLKSAPVAMENRSFASQFVPSIVRYHGVIVGVCLLVVLFFGCGLIWIKSTVKLQDRFGSRTKIIQDYQWLEKNLGALVPLEVVVKIDKGSKLNLAARLALLREIEATIQEVDGVGATMSADTFNAGMITNTSRYITQTTFRKRMQQARLLYERGDNDTFWMEREQFWRIAVRAKALGDLDYGRFTQTLESQVGPVIAKQDEKVSFTTTGVIPLIYKAQRVLLRDLVKSFFAAFCVITVVMIFVTGNYKAGLIVMLPNLFPTIVIFGGMGWLGILIQIGAVMTASAALGIAVDGTVHFLTWYRRGLDNGSSRPAALRRAFNRCSGAMIHSTLICGVGLSVFALSSFLPIISFSCLMVCLLLAALVGDLILLPALLASPIGGVFQRTPASDTATIHLHGPHKALSRGVSK